MLSYDFINMYLLYSQRPLRKSVKKTRGLTVKKLRPCNVAHGYS
jgi:hypothetical protein